MAKQHKVISYTQQTTITKTIINTKDSENYEVNYKV